MNQRKKRTAEIPGKVRIFCLGMLLTLTGLTGCGRQELEFYTQEELAEASGTGTQEEAAESAGQDPDAAEQDSQPETQSGGDAAGTPAAAQEETTSAPEPAKIFVDVCGAVASPGVYELEADSRVFQAIELAGGYLPEAAQNYLNRAGFLTDGQQIYVPTQAEVDENPEKFGNAAAALASEETSRAVSEGGTSANTGESVSDGKKVNLNTADLSELTTLNGIGETRAQAIIAYRESNGNFQSVEDLMKVDGIKEGIYAKIKDQITVD